MNIKHTISATALTAALLIGGTTAAFAGGNGGSDDGSGASTTDRSAKIAALCEHQDEIVPHLTDRQTHLTERITRLTELQAKATANGRTRAAERIGKRLTHLQGQLDRVTTRIANAPTWIAEHCS